MSDPLKDLRQIIDEQSVEHLKVFIEEHPDINYDDISPNGLSALWWALMPPRGKSIATDVITCLLAERKSDGGHLVNPLQTLSGLTPRQYLQCYLNNIVFGKQDNMFKTIREAERAAQTTDPANQTDRSLKRIAEDAQNAHAAPVTRVTSENIIRLYQHYVLEGTMSLDEGSAKTARQEIENFIQTGAEVSPEKVSQIRAGIEFCFNNSASFDFEAQEGKGESFRLTLTQLLTLNWIAAKEANPAQLPEGAADDEALKGRKTAVLNGLYDIATAYGKYRPSCAGGACNRFGMMLAAQHKLVSTSPEGEKLKGEIAKLIILRILGECLESLSKESPDRYWEVIAYLAGISDDDMDSYQTFISDKKPWFLGQIKNEGVDEKIAIEYFNTLEEGTYPLSNHKTSYHLFILMDLFKKFQLGPVLWQQGVEFNMTIDQAVERLAQERLIKNEHFRSLIKRFGITQDPKRLLLAKSFIQHWFEMNRRSEVTFDLFRFINGQEGSQFAEECFLLSFFSMHKEELKRKIPAQSKWLESLKNKQIVVLLDAIHKDDSQVLDGCIDTLKDRLLHKAVELGFFSGMSLENMHLKDLDLRGLVLSGVKLNGVTFENCTLPFEGIGIECINVTLMNCHLSGHDTAKDEDSYVFLSNLLERRNYLPSTLLISSILSKFNQNSLLQFSKKHGNALLLNAVSSHTEAIKAILDSDQCSPELLSLADSEGINVLHWAILWNKVEIVKAILESKHFNTDILRMKIRMGGFTPLHIAMKHAGIDIVKAILESNQCTENVLEEVDSSGRNALHLAAKEDKKEVLDALLKSGKCTFHALTQKDNFTGIQVKDYFYSDTYIGKKLRSFAYYQKIWEGKESYDEKVLAILSDYCKGEDTFLASLSLFAHGNFNRSHTDRVRGLLKKYSANEGVTEILSTLKSLNKNPDGSLARRLEFIESKPSLPDSASENCRMEITK